MLLLLTIIMYNLIYKVYSIFKTNIINKILELIGELGHIIN